MFYSMAVDVDCPDRVYLLNDKENYMPKKTKVADVYQKRGSVYKTEKTFGEKAGEFIGAAVVIFIILAVIGAVT